MNIIWTEETTRFLYHQLVKNFGPHEKWEQFTQPQKNDKKYDQWCNNFAKIVGANSKKAVQQQVAWSLTIQKCIKNKGHIKTYLRNKYMALQTGFISDDYIPNYILTENE